MVEIKKDETLDDLILSGLKIIQKATGFRFAIDAVLLAHFASLKKGDRVMDLGTGTGVIPVILSTRLVQGEIVAIDIQPEVVEMAQRTIQLNNLQNIKIMAGDFKDLPASYNGRFTLVTANPPYWPVDKGKISPNQAIAISRHELRANLREVVATASRLLNNGGRFSLVHRSERLAEIIHAMCLEKIEPKRLRLVYPQERQPANLVLIEGVKGGKAGLTVEEPLVVYDQQGQYTREVLKFYYGGDSYA